MMFIYESLYNKMIISMYKTYCEEGDFASDESRSKELKKWDIFLRRGCS